MKKRLLLIVTIFVSVVSFIGLSVGYAQASSTSATSTGNSCRNVNVPVSLAAGKALAYQVSGVLCRPKTLTTNVDVLVHGGSYGRSYWDFPVKRPDYSYVNRTLNAGRAVFYFDQIGTGLSSKPLSLDVSFDAAVYVTHQLVQYVRKTGFKTVNLIGHSLGSVTVVREAAVYKDVDRVVVTGMNHGAELLPSIATSLGVKMYPAIDDPQFQGSGIDVGYLTTRPGAREELFYYRPNSDQAVIDYDEAHKDIFSAVMGAGAATDVVAPAFINISNSVTAPVLLVVGQYDTPFCADVIDCSTNASVAAHEAPYYSKAKTFTAVAVPNTGHSLTLHRSASASFNAINNWIKTH